MAVALKDIMDSIAGRLVAADYKNVYAFPTSPVQTPGVVVGYPTDIEFDTTFNRGGDEYTIPVFFLVGKNLTEAARDSLSDVIAGAAGIKGVIESAVIPNCSLHVTDAQIETVPVAGIEYLSATFTVNVITQNDSA